MIWSSCVEPLPLEFFWVREDESNCRRDVKRLSRGSIVVELTLPCKRPRLQALSSPSLLASAGAGHPALALVSWSSSYTLAQSASKTTSGTITGAQELGNLLSVLSTICARICATSGLAAGTHHLFRHVHCDVIAMVS